MPRLFVDTPLQVGHALSLPEAAARHAQVLRLQPGEALVLFDGSGGQWHARVTHMNRREVDVQIESHEVLDNELPLDVTLAVVAPANERFEWLVEKATELGVAAIQPLIGERSVLRLPADRAERKRVHWQGIAVAAAEQCGRAVVPAVQAPLDLRRWLAQRADAARPEAGALWLLSLARAEPLRQALADVAGGAPRPALTVLSGPEGGFTDAEEDAARAAGARAVRLGPRVLRAETAPLAVLAALSAQVEARESRDLREPPAPPEAQP